MPVIEAQCLRTWHPGAVDPGCRPAAWHQLSARSLTGLVPRRRTERPDPSGAQLDQTTAPVDQNEASLCQEVPLIFLVARDVVFLLWGSRRDRSVDSGPGVAWPKSRCSGCEPAALATESFPGCPPGPSVLAAAAARRASAWRRAKMASLMRRLRERSASLRAESECGQDTGGVPGAPSDGQPGPSSQSRTTPHKVHSSCLRLDDEFGLRQECLAEGPAGTRRQDARQRNRRPWFRPSRPSAPVPSGRSSTGSCAR